MPRGGVPGNRGGGRRAVDGARQVVRVSVCLEPDQKRALAALGGSAFVRAAIASATRGSGQAPTEQKPDQRAEK
jgi:hypothetical protein